MPETFDAEFRKVFSARYESLYRYLDRLSGDSELAADLVQEAFARLYRRGSMPDNVAAWLVTVANNLFRDERRRVSGRLKLLARRSPETTLGDPAPEPDGDISPEETRRMVRRALMTLDERAQKLLLLRHEGYSYRDLARALDLRESSVGTMLARASEAFRSAFEESRRAPH